jgi:hypothetical protein
VGGVEGGFFGGGGENFYNPEQFIADDNPYSKYIADMLPVAQFGQNNYQYRSDFGEAQRRWEAEFGSQQGQNQFQQQLATQQQRAAEQQAALAAGQWGQQFGHTQQMDWAGMGLQGQQIGNEFTMGMDRNAADRYAAELGMQGQLGSADRYADAQRHAANMGVNEAHIGADANRYGADQQLAGAYAYADAQKHQANMGVNEAHIGAGADRYGSELGLQGQLGSANIYGGAQRYQSDQDLAAAKYQWDMQMRMNQAMMQNNLQVANTQAYGRSQAPAAQWARSWS